MIAKLCRLYFHALRLYSVSVRAIQYSRHQIIKYGEVHPSHDLLGDRSVPQANRLKRGAGVVQGLRWEARHELVLALYRSGRHDECMDIANDVGHVEGQRGALTVVEPDLKFGLRLRLIDI